MRKAFDAVSTLKALKPIVAETGDKKAIDGLNAALRKLRGEDAAGGENAYRMMQDALRPADTIDDSALQNSISVAAAFENLCRRYHRKNPSEVEL
jgi:hypothetical protein